MPETTTPAQVAVIGCGPAGLTAAIQLQRYGLSPLVFEKNQVGGLLKNANLVENYPGFRQGISGPELVQQMASQLAQAGVSVINEEVTCLDYPSRAKEAAFEIQTPSSLYLARQVILATGTRPLPFVSINIPSGVKERVFYEVYPLLNTFGRQIVIVGAGDAAFDYALNLARRENQVVILNRDRLVKCLPLLWERAVACSKIRYFDNTSVVAVSPDTPGGPLRVQCGVKNHTWDIMAHYLLFAIGRGPELSCLTDRLSRQMEDLAAAGKIYPVGDLKNGLFRQTAIAAGDGLRAAMEIYQALA